MTNLPYASQIPKLMEGGQWHEIDSMTYLQCKRDKACVMRANGKNDQLDGVKNGDGVVSHSLPLRYSLIVISAVSRS